MDQKIVEFKSYNLKIITFLTKTFEIVLFECPLLFD